MKRVVITGRGSINALGHDVSETLRGFRHARAGIGPLKIRDLARLGMRIGAAVTDYREDAYFSRQELALFDRFTQFALLAANEAVSESGLAPEGRFDGALAERGGVILGTAGGGLGTQDDNFRAVYKDGKSRVHPLVVPRLMNNAAASHLSMRFNLKGPTYSVASACASSNHAMGQAFNLVRLGQSPVMLTGGAEAMLCFGGIKAWEGLRVLSPDACRPFSKDRNGMVLGEGAAVFVFEEFEHARARGARMLAEVVGFAMCADAGDIVSPRKEGAVRAMQGALRDAGLAPESVGYINAHGTGTRVNDRSESAAIHAVFGAHARHLAVSSTKSMHGHLIGATGAVELLACIMALDEGVIAPTIGYRVPDPECALDVVANAAREAPVEVALSNAFAFGGLNAVLALRRV